MREPPRLFAKRFVDHSACQYYRIDVPTRTLKDHYGVDLTVGGEWETQTEKERQNYLVHLGRQDFVFYYASGGESTKTLVKYLNKIKANKNAKGDMEVGPCYLTDLDDCCDYINPLNSRFKELGTRMPNGRLLKPGEAVNILLPSGERVEIWKDGRDGTDWKANQESIRAMNWCFKNAAGTTFTTKRLADYYQKRYHLKNVHVLPNSVIFDDYPEVRLRPEPGVIKLMWQGGDSHYPDFYPMKQALETIMARHEELRLVIWGPLYPWVYENIPRDRIEHHNWVPYDAYKIKLSALDFDIALAPLVGNKFNMFKSCIKWYEVSALADPKPILAAREAPYADEIQDGKTGFLFDMPTEKDPTANEFLFKLERLIRSEKLRRELATNAREWVIQNRSAISTVGDYWEWLKETRERYEAAKIKQAMR
ncbi:MAG: hypothetical protein ACXAEN_20140 [Candidatus Thorarchaeota archaeon]|jgi:glycosyltransferase involved in cell wall biosynthesis